MRKCILQEEHPDMVQSYTSIGLLYYELTEYDNALQYLNYALDLANKIWTGAFSFKADIYNNLGLSSTYRSLGKYEGAINVCMKGRDMRRNIFGEQSIDYALSLNNLALIYYEMDKLSEAQKFFEKALNIKKLVLPEKHCHISIGYFNLGLVYDKLNQDSEALDNYRKAMEIDNELGAYEDVLFTAEYMAEIYERNGMIEEAEIYRSLGKNM